MTPVWQSEQFSQEPVGFLALSSPDFKFCADYAEIIFLASSKWVPQMTSRLLMEGFLGLITIATMLMR